MKWAVLWALLLAAPSAHAAESKPHLEYGNAATLASKCHNVSGEMFFAASCYEFLRGLMHGLNFGSQICLSSNASEFISNGRLTDIFLGFLAKHPERAEQPDSIVAALALREAFPCPAK